MKYRSIKGTADILPQNLGGSVELRQIVEANAKAIFRNFAYNEIRTPIIEEKALFVKSIGDETDIVKKEMFTFKDRGERDIALRPEGTAPIIRAYLENNIYKTSPFQKFYYIGPMFRAERPQAGRMRQFHQIGLEAIGSDSPALDAEVIEVFIRILDSSGIKNYRLKINNLGCREDKKRLSKIIKDTFSKKGVSGGLCDDCKRRLKDNPLRVLDCKNENCKTAVKLYLKSPEFLCQDCKVHFDEVLKFLNLAKIGYTVDPYIVRGLDYYTRTVFEVTHHSLGAQDAIGAGGRYDNLVSDMGGPKTGAVGFALGVERLLMVSAKDAAMFKGEKAVCVYIATLGKAAYEKGFTVAGELRNNLISCDLEYENKSLKSQMRSADRLGARLVLIIGEDEIARGEATLRDMKTKEQTGVKFDEITRRIKERIG